MKKSIFIILLVFFSLQYSSAQSYHPFPDSSARWSENFYSGNPSIGGHFSVARNGWFYALGNDTIINSLKYNLVGYQSTFYSITHDGVLTGANNVLINPPGQIFGAIREDSSKKIWFRNFFSDHSNFPYFCFSLHQLPADTEIILYDFDLHIGDSIHWAIGLIGVPKMVVSTDSILFGDGSYRKRFLIYCPISGEEYWIEGMGSTQGLFGAYHAPLNWVDDNHPCSLSCFRVNEQILFNTSEAPNEYECDSTFYYLSPEPEDSVTGLKNAFLYYSHTEKKIYFSFENKKYVNDDLIIYNRIGQEVFRKKITEIFFSISVPTLVTGIYFYKIDDDYSKPLIGKFLIE